MSYFVIFRYSRINIDQDTSSYCDVVSSVSLTLFGWHKPVNSKENFYSYLLYILSFLPTVFSCAGAPLALCVHQMRQPTTMQPHSNTGHFIELGATASCALYNTITCYCPYGEPFDRQHVTVAVCRI